MKATSAVQAPGLAHLVVAGRYRHPAGAGGHDEDADALAGRGVGVGSREDHEHVRGGGVGDVPLEPVDDPSFAVAPCGGDQPARVGPGVGFGQGEGGDDLAGGQPGQPLLALFFGPGQDQDLPGDPVVRAEQRPERGAGVAELDGQPHLLIHRQAEAAVLGGQGVAVQAHLLGLLDQPGGYLVGFVDPGFGGHHLTPDELAHHVEQLVEFRLGHHERDPNSQGQAAEGPGFAIVGMPKTARRRKR